MSLFDRLFKRAFDVLLSFLLIFLLLPVFLILFLLGLYFFNFNPFFTQVRIGLHGVCFNVYKFKSMRDSSVNCTVTTLNDSRITPYGAFLRRYKLDELPQLFNIFFGSMSFVGPRPDVPSYADLLEGEDRIILSVRPGITGPASIKYRDEEAILALVENPELYNRQVIWKDKISINKSYVRNYSLLNDFIYLIKTFNSL